MKLIHICIAYRLSLEGNNKLRMELGAANTLQEFKRIVNVIKETYLSYHEGLKMWEFTTEENSQNLILPPWICQPYVRMAPDQHIKLVKEKEKEFLDGVIIFTVRFPTND